MRKAVKYTGLVLCVNSDKAAQVRAFSFRKLEIE